MTSTLDKMPSGAIIDLDGTLLDSLPFWDRLNIDYLHSKGKVAEPGLHLVLKDMEIDAGSAYLKEHYGLSEDTDTIASEIFAMIRHVYTDEAPLFPGAAEFLQSLHATGTRLALFTSTEQSLAEAALARHHVLDLFTCVISTVASDLDKHSPESFLRVLERLGADLHRTVVYDDATYALEAAKKAGLRTVGVRTEGTSSALPPFYNQE